MRTLDLGFLSYSLFGSGSRVGSLIQLSISPRITYSYAFIRDLPVVTQSTVWVSVCCSELLNMYTSVESCMCLYSFLIAWLVYMSTYWVLGWGGYVLCCRQKKPCINKVLGCGSVGGNPILSCGLRGNPVFVMWAQRKSSLRDVGAGAIQSP